jgi:sulfur relay protein TusB/DsrH
MAEYLLIESRDPFDSKDSEQFYNLAQQLAKNGNGVTLFLIQNGVLSTRSQSAYAKNLSDLAKSKVKILTDAFSLKERAIQKEEMIADVKTSDVNELVDLLMKDHVKPIWH